MKLGTEKLIGKYLSGNASQEDEKELFDWIKEDTANQDLFDQAKNIWAASSGLKKESEDITEKAWEDFKLLAANEPAATDSKIRFRPLHIAAALVLIITLVFLIKYFTPVASVNVAEKIGKPVLNKEKEEDVDMICITTLDSAKVFFLPDNSRVHLNKNSSLTYPEKFNNNERATLLSGEAFFEVIDVGIPFTVECKQTRTTANATSFNIRGYEEDKRLTVSVVRGIVQVSNKEKETLILKANEKGIVDSEKASLSKTKNNDKRFMWWKKAAFKARFKKMIKRLKRKRNK